MQYKTHDENFIYLTGTTKEANKLGAVFVKSHNAYRIPIVFNSVREAFLATNDPTIQEIYSELVKEMELVNKLKAKQDIKGDKKLRPYQRVDVQFIKDKGSVAVFNEQRTGKTPTVLTAVKDLLGQGIVVCPASLKLNWQMEYDQWVGKGETAVIRGSKAKRHALYDEFSIGKLSMIFISYETLRSDIQYIVDHIKKVDVLIADEAHRLRNYRSQQSIALYTLRKIADYVLPLTGTPAVNHPSDVFGIFRFLNPKKYSSYWQFIERYFGYTEGRFGRELLDVRTDRAGELKSLLNTMSIQRKREEVMSWIPKVQKRKIYLDPDNKQLKHYDTILKEFMYGENVIPNVIAQLTRLRQVCLDPSLLELEGDSPKTKFLLEFLEDNNEKVIVFSAFTSFLKKLHQVIPNSELLIGEMNEDQKAAAVYNAQYGNTRVLLANIQVGGTGWTLDNIDTIIFTDRSFNPIDNEQAADRFIPTDPNKVYGAKQIIDIMIKNTIENKIDALLEDKINIIQFINNYGYNAMVNYDKGENNNNASVSD
jgi:SNF2 family DNA or RNA helicase